ncbi:hypothetical protein MUY35_01100 [Aliiroseovarius sp. S1339]|uniref:hypothetical protein n=1 Tax=Aliiroseovarius sp. S1339 TaxID=2936990 RepID=UPI0020BF12C1|nr:hypothetical protein [Aliiroseovarius sp. S1339]MCK8462443.1 hypothetical protein [Aliiroseovarius sp. S1339]
MAAPRIFIIWTKCSAGSPARFDEDQSVGATSGYRQTQQQLLKYPQPVLIFFAQIDSSPCAKRLWIVRKKISVAAKEFHDETEN